MKGFALAIFAGSVLILFAKCAFSFVDNDGPINISSEHLQINYGQNIIEYKENVFLEQNNFNLKCDKMIIHYNGGLNNIFISNTETSKSSVKKIYFYDNVTISKDGKIAKGDFAELDSEKNILILTGNIAFKESGSYLEGEKVVYNTKTGIFKVVGSKSGDKSRVKMLIDD